MGGGSEPGQGESRAAVSGGKSLRSCELNALRAPREQRQ